MDAREWRDEIADAVDYYNGMGFDQAEEEGIIKAEADLFAANIPWTGGSTSDNAAIERYFEARERASSKIDEVWYGICYGPFGAGSWNLLTKGVQNGWRNIFKCDESAAFQNIGDFDWRCASLGQDVDDVLEMSEMCPISGNPTIIGGIDLALDFAENGGLSTNQKSRVVRFLKRAFGELYKRGKAVMKIEGEDADIASYFDQLSERELAAQRFFGRAVMPDFEDFCERSDLMIKAGRRRIERINERFDLWIKERRGQSPQ